MFVMILLDSLTARNALKQRKMVNTVMAALKSPGVEGVMMDVWWGLVESEEDEGKNDIFCNGFSC